MEQIFKIYNDGNHFVGTMYSRHAYDVIESKENYYDVTYIEKPKIVKGNVYDEKEFMAENRVIKHEYTKKHTSIKFYEDYLKGLISKYSLSDYSESKIEDLCRNEFIKEHGDIVFYFDNGKSKIKDSVIFLDEMFKKFRKNLFNRVSRFRKKAYNNKWNYFVTFTYDSSIHSEETFITKIKKKLSNLHNRKGWLYMGVFERSSIGRLHFHGLFYIPKDEMIGELKEISDYSTEHHKKQTRIENTIFRKQFGINDFKSLEKEDLTKGNVLNYILKYIGKTGEPIYYSRGIKTFIYIKLNDDNDFIAKMIHYMSIRYVLFDDVLENSIEIKVKRMNC